MNLRHTPSLAAALAIALTACSTDVVSPPESSMRPVSAVSASTSGDDAGYIVTLRNSNSAQSVRDKVASLGGSVIFMHPATGFAYVHGLDAAGAGSLARHGGVAEVQANATFKIDQPASVISETTADDVISSQANPATALRYVWQWNMRLIGANTAWAAGKLGSAAVRVAILDTGLDYDIPDLNGLVDLTRSISFVPSDDSLTAARFATRHVINDYNGHGTNVASQVSSKAFALAGVTSRTTLMGVKVLGRTGSGTTGGVLSGILYAADNGADIANMSLGSAFAKSDGRGFHSLFNKVFNYARQQGMLIVVAAGNEETNLDDNGNEYAAYCDAVHVICVSSVGPRLATTSQNDPAYYTNYGTDAIDVAAPGGNADAANGFTVSAWPWGNGVASWVWSYCPKYLVTGFSSTGVPALPCISGTRLNGYIGTSQAAPHVAGLAALLAAEGMKPNAIKERIATTANDLGPVGPDQFYGRGRINVAAALGL